MAWGACCTRCARRLRLRALLTLASIAVVPAVAAGVGIAGAGDAAAQGPSGRSTGQAGTGPPPRELAARPSGGERLRATIRRTRYGVPHIQAPNVMSAAYGFAYAFAEDNVCTIADSYVTVNAQRSRFFGPDEDWTFSGNGTVNNNLLSDFYFKSVKKNRVVERLIRTPPPRGPLPEVERGVRGYVAGYNQYLRETGVENIPDPRCRGERWVRPITQMDVYRRFYQLGILASAGAGIEGIAGAAPVLDPAAAARAEEDQRAAFADPPDSFAPLSIGSNAYGLGAQATSNGRGMLLGNPHFPWDGAERLYQAHMTVPGKLDVAGATLYGVPLVLIGHTDGLAWSHTVATAWRFTPFELTLAANDPHSYVVDGQVRQMEPTRVSVRARTEDGGLERRRRTLYETEYGPVITELAGLPFPWTSSRAFALGDANDRNFRYLNHFYRTNLAQSVRKYDRIQRRYQGIPWVNSIASDRRGNAYYSMDGAIPNVPDSKVAACGTELGQPLFGATGIPVLDGSRSSCDWDTDPDAVAPGIFGPSAIPRLVRRDYVHNGNDSHWVSNPEEPLEGFDRIIGDERTERSLRTRLGLEMVEDRLAGEDGLAGRRFSLSALQRAALGNRQYAGELWRDELVTLCEAPPPAGLGPGSEACAALRGWNLRDDLDSDGAILFRRFASNLLGNFPAVPTGTASAQRPGSQSVFVVPFNPDDPVHTPRDLNVANPLVRRALDDAVADLESAGIPLDAPLRPWQYDVRAGERIPIHGGPGDLGVFNAINVSFDGSGGRVGYPDVPHGTSFLTAVQFTGGGCPVNARTFVTYGQSENPRSPHANDYTRAFSRKGWNDVPYCRPEIRADPALEVDRISKPQP